MTPILSGSRRPNSSRRLAIRQALLLSACYLPLAVGSAFAEDIVYDSAAAGTGAALKTSPIGGATSLSLFPGSSAVPGASGNSVTVHYGSGFVPYRVFGGLSETAAVTDNAVNMVDGWVSGNVYGGLDAAANGAHRNSVAMSGGYVWGDVLGGMSSAGDVTGNTASISGGTVDGSFFGAFADGDGIAEDNHAIVSGGSVSGYVYGAYSRTGAALGNSVDISSGVVQDYVYGGYVSSPGTAQANGVTMSGGTVTGSIFGGATDGGTSLGNTVYLSGGSVVSAPWIGGGSVYGGYDYSSGEVSGNAVNVSGSTTFVEDNATGGRSLGGAATGNTISVADGTIGGNAYGGYGDAATASGNSALLTGGIVGGQLIGGLGGSSAEDNMVAVFDGTVGGNVYGGDSFAGTATGNSTRVAGGLINGHLLGGYGQNGSAHNTVTVSGGTIGLNVYGGESYSVDSFAEYNSVLISGGTLNGYVTGGYSTYGTSRGNTVTIAGGDIAQNVIGGTSESVLSTGNSVVMSGGEVQRGIFGGYSDIGQVSANGVVISAGTVHGDIFGGQVWSGGGAVTGNHVDISGGNIAQSVFGGQSLGSGDVTQNSVAISGGVIGQFVHGGNSSTGTAAGNSVTLSGGTLLEGVAGGSSDDGLATDNRVVVSGGEVGLAVGGIGEVGATGNSVIMSGGLAWAGLVGGGVTSGIAGGNSVTMTGGVAGGFVVGGVVQSDTASAIGNTVTIFSGANVAAATLYGGYSEAPGGLAVDLFTGNTLNVVGIVGPVQGAHNFQNYNFLLPTSLDVAQPLLTITGGTATDLTGTSVAMAGTLIGGAPLKSGDVVTLISSTTGTPVDFSADVRQGVSLLYDFDLLTGNDALQAVVTSAVLNPQTKALTEGRAAQMAFVNQGGDLVAGPGIASALAATRIDAEFALFGTASGGSSRYDTGSHVDADGFSLLGGVAWHKALTSGDLVLGTFVEAGWGNYDSFNSFANAASVRGSGNTDYYGWGVLGRYDVTEGELAGLYGEASTRIGRAGTDFDSADLGLCCGGQNASYDSDSTYYGAHAGLGYIWKLSAATSLDFSTRYLWSHLGSDSVNVLGDPVSFGSMDSHRWRNGVRLTHTVDNGITAYVGAAWEQEFGGKAKATTYGYDIDAASLKGGTAIGEFGVSFRPQSVEGLSVDLGMQGYVGEREGITGNLQVKYAY